MLYVGAAAAIFSGVLTLAVFVLQRHRAPRGTTVKETALFGAIVFCSFMIGSLVQYETDVVLTDNMDLNVEENGPIELPDLKSSQDFEDFIKSADGKSLPDLPPKPVTSASAIVEREDPLIVALSPPDPGKPPLAAEGRKIALASGTFSEKLGEAVSNLEQASATITAPKEMVVHEPQNLAMRLSAKRLPRTLVQILESQNKNVLQGEARTSDWMIATATGVGFTIEPLKEAKQRYVKGVPTEWDWKIEATSPGTREIKVSLYLALQTDEGSAEFLYDSFSQSITVSSRPQTWIEWMKTVTEALNTANTLVIAFATLVGSIMTLIVLKLIGSIGSIGRWISTYIFPLFRRKAG